MPKEGGVHESNKVRNKTFRRANILMRLQGVGWGIIEGMQSVRDHERISVMLKITPEGNMLTNNFLDGIDDIFEL